MHNKYFFTIFIQKRDCISTITEISINIYCEGSNTMKITGNKYNNNKEIKK